MYVVRENLRENIAKRYGADMAYSSIHLGDRCGRCRNVEVDLKLDVILKHVRGVEHLQSNEAPVSVEIRVAVQQVVMTSV